MDKLTISGALRKVQRYSGDGDCFPPLCQYEGCYRRAVGLYADEEGKGWDLCFLHEPNGRQAATA